MGRKDAAMVHHRILIVCENDWPGALNAWLDLTQKHGQNILTKTQDQVPFDHSHSNNIWMRDNLMLRVLGKLH